MEQKVWDTGYYAVGNRELLKIHKVLVETIGSQYDFEFFVDQANATLHVQLAGDNGLPEAVLHDALVEAEKSNKFGLTKFVISRGGE